MSALEQNASRTAPGADASAIMSEYLSSALEMRSAFGAIDTNGSGTLEINELEVVVNDTSLVTGAQRRAAAQVMIDHFEDIRFFQPAGVERPFGRDVDKPTFEAMGRPYMTSIDKSDFGISQTDLLAMKLAIAKTETDSVIAKHRKMAVSGAAVQVGLGVTATVGGALLLLVPEPTMTTKVGGGALLLAGAGSFLGALETLQGKELESLEYYNMVNLEKIKLWTVPTAALAPVKQHPQSGSAMI